MRPRKKTIRQTTGDGSRVGAGRALASLHALLLATDSRYEGGLEKRVQLDVVGQALGMLLSVLILQVEPNIAHP